MKMDRRGILLATCATAALTLLGVGRRAAHAQTEATLSALADIAGAADELAGKMRTEEQPLPPGVREFYARNEFDLRRAVARTVEPLSRPEIDEVIAARGHLDPTLFREAEVSPVPDAAEPLPVADVLAPPVDTPSEAPAEVPAAEVPPPPPPPVRPPPPERPVPRSPTGTPEPPRERVADVVLDIVFDALGIAGIESLKEAASQADGLAAVWDEIDRAATAGEMRRLTEACFDLVELLAQARVLRGMLERVSRDSGRRLLAGLAARCVPFIGPALFIVALGLSISRNWRRLEEAVRA